MAKKNGGGKSADSFWKGESNQLGKLIPKRPLSDSSAKNDIPDLPRKG